MIIDWFTVGAQALNFLILVWLLKRFLYKPILNAIDVREKRIAAELADAGAKKAEAQKQRDEFQHKNEVFDQERAALFAHATDEAKAERQRLFDAARTAADAVNTKRTETLRSEAQQLSHTIARRTQEEVFAIARKTLSDLASISLEDRMIDVFIGRVRNLDANTKQSFTAGFQKATEPALIRSTFELPVAQRAALQKALNETFSADVHIRFDTSPDQVSGIELTTQGQRLAWSISDYLASMEKGVDDILKSRQMAQTKLELKAALVPTPSQITNNAEVEK